jgi:hypothetical protein
LFIFLTETVQIHQAVFISVECFLIYLVKSGIAKGKIPEET